MLDNKKYANPCMRCRNFGSQCGKPGGMPMPLPANAYPSLAIVYSPYQGFDELYTPTEAMGAGTLFKGLNKPFCGTCSGDIKGGCF